MKSEKWKMMAMCLWIVIFLIVDGIGFQIEENVYNADINKPFHGERDQINDQNGHSMLNSNQELEELMESFEDNMTRSHNWNSSTVDRHFTRSRRDANQDSDFIVTNYGQDPIWQKLYYEEIPGGKRIRFSVKGHDNAEVTLRNSGTGSDGYPWVQVIINGWIRKGGKSAFKLFL
ncbi:unnamed protein product [Meganyctiphanes norvegica]|uniref:Uncharacterized protein n=1 Tax=Meganyctiphanes norvegica TaxID=48144 RepID=A0AAV2RY79_MEGNR